MAPSDESQFQPPPVVKARPVTPDPGNGQAAPQGEGSSRPAEATGEVAAPAVSDRQAIDLPDPLSQPIAEANTSPANLNPANHERPGGGGASPPGSSSSLPPGVRVVKARKADSVSQEAAVAPSQLSLASGDSPADTPGRSSPTAVIPVLPTEAIVESPSQDVGTGARIPSGVAGVTMAKSRPLGGIASGDSIAAGDSGPPARVSADLDELPPVILPPGKASAAGPPYESAGVKLAAARPIANRGGVAEQPASPWSLPVDIPPNGGRRAEPGGKSSQTKSRFRSGRRNSRPITVVCVISVLAALGGLSAWFFWPQPDPDEQWQAAQDYYSTKSWKAAEGAFNKFKTDFPLHPHAADVPFFLDMCQAGRCIHSNSDQIEEGLRAITQVFKDYRDKPQYKAYCASIYDALARLVEKFCERATKDLQPADLARADEALDLLEIVAQSSTLRKVEALQQKLARLSSQIASARATLNRDTLLSQARQNLQRGKSGDPDVDLDAVYALDQQLAAQQPELASDPQLRKLRAEVWQTEPQRVKYLPDTNALVDAAFTGENPDSPQTRTVFVVWGDESRAAPARSGSVALALFQGVLYAFDEQGGLRWARRLGIDAHRLPVRIEGGPAGRSLVVAVSTEDNRLLALDSATGRMLWEYAAGDESTLSAPLTLVSLPPQDADGVAKHYGLLPTARGEVHVLELVLGQRLGVYRTGYPMTVGGAYDPQSRLVYMPADSKRVFALDPFAVDDPEGVSPCRGVLLTEHLSGSLRGAPAVVGKYLILAETAALDRTRLSAYELRYDEDAGKPQNPFPEPRSQPLKAHALVGWSWFSPRQAPDRITVITDEGHLGVFGLNLDNFQEALFPEIQDAAGQCPKLPVRDPFRSLAVYSDEHLLWVMSGGVLQKLLLDKHGQKVRRLWPAADSSEVAAGAVDGRQDVVAGIPVHEAQTDRFGRVFYLATMSVDGRRYEFTSVASDEDRLRWRRELGLNVAADPAVVAGGVVLLDQAGRLVELRPEHLATSRLLRLPSSAGLPGGAAPGPLVVIPGTRGRRFSLAIVDQGRQVALRELAVSGSRGGWSVWELPGGFSLHGQPAVCGNDLVTPCSDGRLYRIRLSDGATQQPNEVNFQWAETVRPGPEDTARVVPLSDNSVLLIDGGRRLRRLDFLSSAAIKEWTVLGQPYAAASEILGQPLVWGQRLILADASEGLVAVAADNPARILGRLEPGGRLTAPPFIRGGRVLSIVDDRMLVCHTLDDAAADPAGCQPPQNLAEALSPAWTAGPFRGRIHGQPVLSDDALLVTDERQVSAVSLADGRTLWSVPLGVHVGPAATAVPLGEGLLVPLADGTLLTLPRPAAPFDDSASGPGPAPTNAAPTAPLEAPPAETAEEGGP